METNAVVETDLTGASASEGAAPDETPGPIFAETDDAPPVPAPAPEPSPKAERLAHVKALAAETKRLADERARIGWERQRDAQMTAAMRAELEALKADPWSYVRDRHGLTAAKVAEFELYPQGEEGRAERAERIALEAQAKLDAIIADARSRTETAERIQAWERAKTAAVSEYEKGASSKWEALDAFVTKTAAKTGQTKQDVLVAELLDTVERVRRDPKFGPHVAEYSDADYFTYMNERYSVVAPPKAKAHSTRTLSTDSTGETKADQKAPFGSATYYKKQAAEIVEAYRAARGEKPQAERTYSQAELDAADRERINSEGREDKAAEARYTKMLIANAKAAARGKR